VEIQSIKHKSIKQLMAAECGNSVKGLSPHDAKIIRRQIGAIAGANHPNELRGFPGWKVHELTPGFPGKWALKVNQNYRLTFMFIDNAVCDLDYEDYH
jgi:proteic killer suppression protein